MRKTGSACWEAQVKVKGQRDLVTVVGSAPIVNSGEWLSAEGAWVIDKNHGRQFKAGPAPMSPAHDR